MTQDVTSATQRMSTLASTVMMGSGSMAASASPASQVVKNVQIRQVANNARKAFSGIRILLLVRPALTGAKAVLMKTPVLNV